ncbi:MAG: hypothetical protein ACI4WR_02250 [Bulleidia sp.]
METKDLFKNLLLASVGAAALTAEKGSEMVDTLIRKGEVTVEQGKALNQELKHKASEAAAKSEAPKESVEDYVKNLSDEDKEKLKKLLNPEGSETETK